MTTLPAFINTTATLILAKLPLQSLDSAMDLVVAYISNIGGWVPDDPDFPNGDGVLANNFTESQAADAIASDQFGAVYDISFSVTLTMNVQAITQLTNGLTLSQAATSMANQVSTFITDTINKSSLPLRIPVSGIGEQTTVDSFSLTGGYTTPEIRLAIAFDITNTDAVKEVDYKGLALLFVKSTYGLDDTWNVQSVYTESNQPIAITIRKYVDPVSYADLDTDNTTAYVINISPETFQIVTGVIVVI